MRKLIASIICAAAGLAAHAQEAGEEAGCDFAPLLALSGWGWLDYMAELYLQDCEDELYTDPPDDLTAYFGEEAVSDAVAAAQSVVDVYRWEIDWDRVGGAFEYIAAGQHHVQREAVEAWSEELYEDIVTLVTTFSDDPDFLFPSNNQGWAVRSLFRAADNPATRLQAMSQFHQLVVNWRPGMANDRSYLQAMYAAVELMRNAHGQEGFVDTVEALDLPDAMAGLVIGATDWIVRTTGYMFMVARVASELGRLLEYTEASFASEVEANLQNILDHPKILPVYDPTIILDSIDANTGEWRNDAPMRGYMIYAAVADAIERLDRCEDFYGLYGDGLNTPCDDRAFVIDEVFPVEEGISHECTVNGDSVNVRVRTQANGVFHQPVPFYGLCRGAPLFYWVELESAPDYYGTGCGITGPDGDAVAECSNWARYFPDDPERNYFVTSRDEFDRLTERSRHAKLELLCATVADAMDDFGDVFGDDLDPVADDNNTDLEVVLFEDDYEYVSYASWLFGGIATASYASRHTRTRHTFGTTPGTFVESDPSLAPDTEGRTPPRVLTYPASSGFPVVSVAEDECFYAGDNTVFDPPADAVELKREAARYYDSRYNLHGKPDMEQVGLAWWDDGVAQHVKAGGRVLDEARGLAMRETPMALSDILMTTYENRIVREHYWWLQLAMLYLTTEQPDSAEYILRNTRAGDYEEAMRYVGLIGAAFDDDWATWLADIVSEGLESTESAIDDVIDEGNLAEGWDETGDGDGTGEGGTDG